MAERAHLAARGGMREEKHAKLLPAAMQHSELQPIVPNQMLYWDEVDRQMRGMLPKPAMPGMLPMPPSHQLRSAAHLHDKHALAAQFIPIQAGAMPGVRAPSALPPLTLGPRPLPPLMPTPFGTGRRSAEEVVGSKRRCDQSKDSSEERAGWRERKMLDAQVSAIEAEMDTLDYESEKLREESTAIWSMVSKARATLAPFACVRILRSGWRTQPEFLLTFPCSTFTPHGAAPCAGKRVDGRLAEGADAQRQIRQLSVERWFIPERTIAKAAFFAGPSARSAKPAADARPAEQHDDDEIGSHAPAWRCTGVGICSGFV